MGRYRTFPPPLLKKSAKAANSSTASTGFHEFALLPAPITINVDNLYIAPFHLFFKQPPRLKHPSLWEHAYDSGVNIVRGLLID
jgi:hypothetical protein